MVDPYYEQIREELVRLTENASTADRALIASQFIIAGSSLLGVMFGRKPNEVAAAIKTLLFSITETEGVSS